MNVTFIDHTATLGGGELALLRTIDALADHAPSVRPSVILFEDGDLARRLFDRGVRCVVVPLGTVNDVRRDHAGDPGVLLRSSVDVARQVHAVSRALRDLGPDLVHTNSMKAHVIGGIAARLRRRPLVWHLRDRLADDYLSRRGARLMRGLAAVLPRVVVANSQATAATLPDRVSSVVIPSPLASDVTPMPEPPGEFTMGCIGRLAPWKGQHVLLDAFSQAFPDGDARLIVVGGALFGEMEYERELRRQALRLGLGDRIEFTGQVDDVRHQLSRMHVVVHCSVVPEPFGQVVVEAMASGRAVVAAAAGGPAEIIESGSTGLLVEPGDATALAAALRRLEGDARLRSRLASEAVKSIEPYRPENVAKRLLSVYARLL